MLLLRLPLSWLLVMFLCRSFDLHVREAFFSLSIGVWASARVLCVCVCLFLQMLLSCVCLAYIACVSRLIWIKRFMCQSQRFGCHLLLWNVCFMRIPRTCFSFHSYSSLTSYSLSLACSLPTPFLYVGLMTMMLMCTLHPIHIGFVIAKPHINTLLPNR